MPAITLLPQRKEMFRQLCSVNNNEWHRVRLYREILKSAGQEKGPHGVVGLLMDAIDTCTIGMPVLMVESIRNQVPEFIDALIAENEPRERAEKIFAAERLSRIPV